MSTAVSRNFDTAVLFYTLQTYGLQEKTNHNQ